MKLPLCCSIKPNSPFAASCPWPSLPPKRLEHHETDRRLQPPVLWCLQAAAVRWRGPWMGPGRAVAALGVPAEREARRRRWRRRWWRLPAALRSPQRRVARSQGRRQGRWQRWPRGPPSGKSSLGLGRAQRDQGSPLYLPSKMKAVFLVSPLASDHFEIIIRFNEKQIFHFSAGN